MFTINRKYIVMIVTAFAFAGCNKTELVPVEQRTEDIIFDKGDINGSLAEQALNSIYTNLPDGFNRIDGSFLCDATDDGITSQKYSAIQILSKALQSPTQVVDDRFDENYKGIYKANVFLSKIDEVPILAVTKQYFKVEARFLRAMFYFELIKRYGGVPLIGDKVLTINDNLNLPRNTYQQCVDYIVNECDAIIPLARKEPLSSVEVGRITQGAVLSLKARTLLYAASPLNNVNNDVTKWQIAANASKAVIDLNYYSLNASYVAVFTTRNDKETILAKQYNRNSNLERADAPIGYTNDLLSGAGLQSPTQELVDAFPTSAGKAISDPTSGYTASSPYANRDPRFYATVFYNGQLWLNRPVETFDGGKDRPGGIYDQTKTGYYLRKFLPDLSTASTYNIVDRNFIIFRYAETLLNYAEALNEVGGAANITLAYAQLTALRKRAGIPAGTGSLYGLKANMTQAEMRDAIRLERRVEMAFEEQRFWDLRRWKTAQADLNKMLHGIKITGNSSAGPFTYQVVNAEPVYFKNQMYLYPIPYSELLKNNALTQNPGW